MITWWEHIDDKDFLQITDIVLGTHCDVIDSHLIQFLMNRKQPDVRVGYVPRGQMTRRGRKVRLIKQIPRQRDGYAAMKNHHILIIPNITSVKEYQNSHKVAALFGLFIQV